MRILFAPPDDGDGAVDVIGDPADVIDQEDMYDDESGDVESDVSEEGPEVSDEVEDQDEDTDREESEEDTEEDSEEPEGDEEEEDSEPERDLHPYEFQLAKKFQGHPDLADVKDLNLLVEKYIEEKGKIAGDPPASPEDYDFGEPEGDAPRDKKLEGSFMNASFSAGLNNGQAMKIAEWFNTTVSEKQKAFEKGQAAAAKELKKEIGKEGVELALRAVKKYGDKDVYENVAETPGSAKGLMKVISKLSSLISEDTFNAPDEHVTPDKGMDADPDAEVTDEVLEEMYPGVDE